MALPASIDNDVPETEISIGVDSALNVIVESIDKLVDTTSAVNRAIVVKTMGHDSGYLAVFGALATGAAEVFYKERIVTDRAVLGNLLEDLNREYASAGRRATVIVVGEGASFARLETDEFIKHIEQSIIIDKAIFSDEIPWDVRTSELGHLQRGGPASAFDRILATRMGAGAVELLNRYDASKMPRMVALKGGEIRSVSLDRVVEQIIRGKTAIDIKDLMYYARLVRELSKIPSRNQRKRNGYLVILTGGADAQGMNMALRATSRYALNKYGVETKGSLIGFHGLINNNLVSIRWGAKSKSKMPHRRAGSILGTKRWPIPFETEEKEKILTNLQAIDKRDCLHGLILIGGLGTALRAKELSEYFTKKSFNIRIVYIPASIDHGLPATNATLGFDTALNVIVSSCDKITDTGQAMERVSIVDTMGGGVGALTLMGALAAGAECAIIAEDFEKTRDSSLTQTSLEEATCRLRKLNEDLLQRERKFATVLLQHRQFQELDIARLHGRADELFKPLEARKTALGHTQRGGNASYFDRLLGTVMGVEAVKEIMEKKKPKKSIAKLLMWKEGKVQVINLVKALKNDGEGQPWSDVTRMENAKSRWQYEEIKKLFNEISVFRGPTKSK